MFTREDIRYHTLWVRALCCFAVAMSVWNAVYFDVLRPAELLLRDLFLGGAVGPLIGLSKMTEISLVFVVCLAVALPRIERPITMVACGSGFVGAYVLAAVIFRVSVDRFPPVAAPLLAILGSTGVLETMAWSEERLHRKKLEHLEEARKQFTDMLVHDLKKRMSSILMSFSVLENSLAKKDAKTAELVNNIHAGSERMLILISNLLDIRKTEEEGMTLRRERLSLRELLADSLADHRAIGDLVGVRINLVGGPDAAIRVDRHVFSRVIANLLWNALQHAPQDSEIEMGYTLDDSEMLALHVANHGQPIPPEEQDSMFEAFVSGGSESQRRRAGSTGLGLAFCKLAVEAHGGTIAIESPWSGYEDGVNLRIRLPVCGALQ